MNAILLPGLDGTGNLFDPLRRHLPSSWKSRVVAYPVNRVMGWAGLADIARRAIPEGGSCVIVAESFSGPVALRVAATMGGNISAVVLCASFVANPLPSWAWLVRALLAIGAFPRRPPRFMVRRLLAGADAPDELVDAACAAVRGVKTEVLASRVRMVLELDGTEWLGVCEAPLLYLRGTRDRLVPSRCADEMKRAKPSLKVVDLKAPHLVLQREPRRAADEIVRLVEERIRI